MVAQPLASDEAHADELRDLRVVVRELRELSVAPVIDAAVADVRDVSAHVGDRESHQGRLHRAESCVALRELVDLEVRVLHGALQRWLDAAVAGG